MNGQVLADVHPTNSVDEAQTGVPGVVPEDLLQDELLIEEISIDGMCGVY